MPYTLRTLSVPVKCLFTAYLLIVAIGYAIAMAQILLTHGMADGEFGLSLNDIVYSYYGNRSGTKLENKLNGSMKANASDNERFQIIQWVRDGAKQKDYEAGIKTIFEQRCIMCHNAEAGGIIPDYTRFEEIAKRGTPDHGTTFSSLTRLSHIHMFGIAFIFMFVGLIFAFASSVPIVLQSAAIVMPYVFLLLDITSWWLTMVNPNFAILVIIGGTGMAMAFTFMLIVSLYEMWLAPKSVMPLK
jgi:hypothetical protein